MVTTCKNKCSEFEQIHKQLVYEKGGCYCRNCDYYFKDKMVKCPCCNTKTRGNTRTNRGKELDIVRID